MMHNDAGSTGCGAEAELVGYAARGFAAATMCVVGRDGFSIANCVRRVTAVRRGLGLNVELMIDKHGSLEVATAIKLAEELASYDIAWFEEPVSPAWSDDEGLDGLPSHCGSVCA
jgi:galactonate dehydratase